MLALTFILASWSGLPFIEDNWEKAVTQAKAKAQPLVVDLWAPWCHSCLSMKNYVFKDALLEPTAARAVFVAIDTDKDVNSGAVDRLKPQAWPTFVIVDPTDQTVVARLIGSTTASEFKAFVEQGISAMEARTRKAPAEPLQLVAEADRLSASGERKRAIDNYRAALAAPGLSEALRGRAAYSLVLALGADGEDKDCAKTALTQADQLKTSYFVPALLAEVFNCRQSARAPLKKAENEQLAARIRQEMERKENPLATDDKSDLYATLTAMAEARGASGEAKRLRQERLAMLETAAKAAPDRAAARTFDAHRVDLYLELGKPEAAVALLTASEKDAPTDYNPPARLARAYLFMGDVGRARAAIARARGLVYGPRTSVILLLEGDILGKAGDTAGARAAYQRARSLLEKQPPTAGVRMRLKDLAQKLAALE